MVACSGEASTAVTGPRQAPVREWKGCSILRTQVATGLESRLSDNGSEGDYALGGKNSSAGSETLALLEAVLFDNKPASRILLMSER